MAVPAIPAGAGALLRTALAEGTGELLGQGGLRLIDAARGGSNEMLESGSRYLAPRESLGGLIKWASGENYRRRLLGLPEVDPVEIFNAALSATETQVGGLRKFEAEQLMRQITGELEKERIIQESALKQQSTITAGDILQKELESKGALLQKEVGTRGDVAKQFLQSSIENILGRPNYGDAASLAQIATPF